MTYDGGLWFQLPKRLPAGWYVVTVRSGTRPVQAILQVTDIAGYLVVTRDAGRSSGRTISARADRWSARRWRATGSTSGARATTGRGSWTRLRRSSGVGRAMHRAICWPVVTVRSGGSCDVPAGDGSDANPEQGIYGPTSDRTRPTATGRPFETDRTMYRRTDTVNTWGVVRDRDTGAVPASVTVRLLAGVEDAASGRRCSAGDDRRPPERDRGILGVDRRSGTSLKAGYIVECEHRRRRHRLADRSRSTASSSPRIGWTSSPADGCTSRATRSR